MPPPREQLAALRTALAQLPEPLVWSTIEAWIAGAKPLLRVHFNAHLPDFEAVVREPGWSYGVYTSGRRRWSGERFDNHASENARTEANNARIAGVARQRILACLDGILALGEVSSPAGVPPTPDAGPPAPPSGKDLLGWFVGIDGSVSESADRARAARCHQTVRALVRGILAAGGGVVTLVTGDPRIVGDDPDSAITFVWTILTEVDAFLRDPSVANARTGPLAWTVWSPRTITDRIPAHQQPLWQRLIGSGRIEVRMLSDAEHLGVKLREVQASLGHALVVLGGGKGVGHLASLYLNDGKPVIPLDPAIGSSRDDGEGALSLHREALIDPARFAHESAPALRTALASRALSLQDDGAVPHTVAGRLVDLLGTTLSAAAQRLEAQRLPPLLLRVEPLSPDTLDAVQLAGRLGGALAAAVRVVTSGDSVLELEVVGASKDSVIGAAETGDLERCIRSVGPGRVQEIWSSDECLYESLEDTAFEYRQPKDVGADAINVALKDVDVLLVTVTDVERKALLARLSPLPNRPGVLSGPSGRQTLRVGRLGRYGVAYVESAMGAGGRSGATLTVSDAIQAFDPKAVIAVGIAFGADRRKHRLGDVLVAETIAPYDLAKVSEAGSTQRGQPLPCGVTLLDRFASAREGWAGTATRRRLRVSTGLVLSGEKVINRKEFRDNLLGHYETAIGGEMEGSGVYAAALRRGVQEVILIKAVCDFADGHKNDRGQPFAARAAVSLVEHVLAKPDALSHLGARDRGLYRGRRS